MKLIVRNHRRAVRAAVWLGFVLILALPAVAATNFIAGADMSLLNYFESNNITYKDNGQVSNALVILKNHGINCIRLRLFTSSAAQAASDPYDYLNNLTYTVPLAVSVKNAGLQFMLDFHYSDTWADPGHQTIPSAWSSLTLTQLVDQMRSYNSNCIAAFSAAGAMPDYVQVGNEITSGMLWTDGQVPGTNAATQWPQLAELINSAIQGIRDAASTNLPQIVIHIDRGGDWSTTEWFFDNLKAQHVQFDIIGESYYPIYHGPPSALSNCLYNAANRYNKPIFVAETDFPWTNTVWTTNIYGISGSTNGQAQYTLGLVQLLKSVPQHLGAGIFWWAAEYQQKNGINEAGFNTASFFDKAGNVLPAADVLGQSAAPLWLSTSLSGTNLNFQWPLSGAGLKLATTTSLSPAAGWQDMNNPIQNTGTLYSASVPVDAGTNRFYRLQSN